MTISLFNFSEKPLIASIGRGLIKLILYTEASGKASGYILIYDTRAYYAQVA